MVWSPSWCIVDVWWVFYGHIGSIWPKQTEQTLRWDALLWIWCAPGWAREARSYPTWQASIWNQWEAALTVYRLNLTSFFRPPDLQSCAQYQVHCIDCVIHQVVELGQAPSGQRLQWTTAKSEAHLNLNGSLVSSIISWHSSVSIALSSIYDTGDTHTDTLTDKGKCTCACTWFCIVDSI